MKLTMRDRSQRPQLSVATAEVGSLRLEAQPLNRSDSINAFPTAKQKIPHRLPSFMAVLHLSETLTLMLQPFSKQEARHEQTATSATRCAPRRAWASTQTVTFYADTRRPGDTRPTSMPWRIYERLLEVVAEAERP
jgi:hypothetical protein